MEVISDYALVVWRQRPIIQYIRQKFVCNPHFHSFCYFTAFPATLIVIFPPLTLLQLPEYLVLFSASALQHLLVFENNPLVLVRDAVNGT